MLTGVFVDGGRKVLTTKHTKYTKVGGRGSGCGGGEFWKTAYVGHLRSNKLALGGNSGKTLAQMYYPQTSVISALRAARPDGVVPQGRLESDGLAIMNSGPVHPRVCLGKKPGQRERERVLGQGDRDGGGPAARAAEGNAGPVLFLASLVERQRWADFLTRHTLGCAGSKAWVMRSPLNLS